MSKLVTIQNDSIIVTISTLGAEVQSIKHLDNERLWQADEKFWKGHSPLLFPICGRLKENYYLHNDYKYEMRIHGIARNSEFEILSHEKASITLGFSSSEESKKVYPFDFKYKVMYKLNGDAMQTYYFVENTGNSPLYYNVGSHEAYVINGANFEDYSIKFEDGETVKVTAIIDNFMSDEKYELPTYKGVFDLKKAYFDMQSIMPNGKPSLDSVVLEDVPSKRATLLYKGEPTLSVYYNDFKNMVLWTTLPADYLAIEVWSGIPDENKTTHILSEKKGIEKLEKGESKTYYHSVTFY
ncbi:MAG: hypothetical protein IJW26_02280 [Clostridia bacterium]|nr:hypothetical protein [Clostridia bacterium]